MHPPRRQAGEHPHHQTPSHQTLWLWVRQDSQWVFNKTAALYVTPPPAGLCCPCMSHRGVLMWWASVAGFRWAAQKALGFWCVDAEAELNQSLKICMCVVKIKIKNLRGHEMIKRIKKKKILSALSLSFAFSRTRSKRDLHRQKHYSDVVKVKVFYITEYFRLIINIEKV